MKVHLIILGVWLSHVLFSTGTDAGSTLPPQQNKNPQIKDLYLPYYDETHDVYHYTGFTLRYEEKYELATWVAYELEPAELIKVTKSKPAFMPDPFIKSGSAEGSDYKGSGYERGHLAPAADMRWSEEALVESYYYSNIAPQKRSLNGGGWKSLEEKIRKWVQTFGPIQIVTGPIFSDNAKRIGPNKMAVPQWYFKAVLAKFKDEYIAAAYIFPNSKANNAIGVYMVTIDEVEKKTGLNLFHKLPDKIEDVIESRITRQYWK